MIGYPDIGGIVDHNIKITKHQLSPKESLNSDGQQFHQY
jgi:hypothetical protein